MEPARARLEHALADCLETLARTPDDPEVRSDLGTVLLGLGRTEEALAAYRAVLGGRRDGLEQRSRDRWLGGVRLGAAGPNWRWDDAARRISARPE